MIYKKVNLQYCPNCFAKSIFGTIVKKQIDVGPKLQLLMCKTNFYPINCYMNYKMKDKHFYFNNYKCRQNHVRVDKIKIHKQTKNWKTVN